MNRISWWRWTFNALGRLALFVVLTATTQVGGLALVLSFLTHGLINRRLHRGWTRTLAKSFSFLVIYACFTFVVNPLLARQLGRVPLPITSTKNVRPANVLTALLNRNYVRPQLRQALFEVALEMNKKHPGTVVHYLDANFPFLSGFPLPPHLSHNDGRKLDVSFHYLDAGTGKATNELPSWIGYGVNEAPLPGEFDRPAACAEKGFWQYSFLSKIISQRNLAEYPFDPNRTKDLVEYFAGNKAIAKILIEPHLKTRLKLNSHKVRLHGCNAVRHDDHLHVQL